MLKYYSYYSVGGYKTFFLGDTENKAEFTYYFPLIPILEEEAKTTESVATRLQELKSLPKIEQMSEDNLFSFPKSGLSLCSDAGYKMIYQHLEGEVYALAVRDVSNNAKDEMGRAIPFVFIITGEGKKDLQTLDALAVYMANNFSKAQSMIAGSIGMNLQLNGLEFNLAKFNAWVNDTAKAQNSTNVITTEGAVAVQGKKDAVSLLILPEGGTVQQAIEAQHLKEKKVTDVAIQDLVNREDQTKLLEQVELMADRLTSRKKTISRLKILLIVVAVVGIALGVVLASVL